MFVVVVVVVGLCHAILVYFKKPRVSSHHLNPKNNGLVLLLKTILRHRNCFLSSVVADGKDGNGLKLEKNGPEFFQVLMLCLQNSPQKYYG